MKTEEIILGNFQLKYPLEHLAPLEQILFSLVPPVSFPGTCLVRYTDYLQETP